MMRKSLTVTVFVLFFTIDCSLAEDLSSPSKGDVILMMERIEKILQEKDFEKFRSFYPSFLEVLVKFEKQMEQNKELNLRDDHWENAVEIPESNREDPSNAVLRMMSAWMNNNDEVKRKRGYHRALCHFKICNMGSKRSNNLWDMWRNSNQQQ